MASGTDDKIDPVIAARRLLRAARVGTLATAHDGQPFASLVTPATAPDGAPLMFLSRLSEHTRHLEANPRCALIVIGVPVEANPQTAPRVTVTGVAARSGDALLKVRWLAHHPYAALYAEFSDFGLWQLSVERALYVGGFAQAHRLRADEIIPSPAAVTAIAEAECSMVAHVNEHHRTAIDAIARCHGGEGTGWRIVTVDTDGCDLALDQVAIRVPWSESVTDPEQIRVELIRLARDARGDTGTA
jgi:putative heme iron utilization protein